MNWIEKQKIIQEIFRYIVRKPYVIIVAVFILFLTMVLTKSRVAEYDTNIKREVLSSHSVVEVYTDGYTAQIELNGINASCLFNAIEYAKSTNTGELVAGSFTTPLARIKRVKVIEKNFTVEAKCFNVIGRLIKLSND